MWNFYFICAQNIFLWTNIQQILTAVFSTSSRFLSRHNKYLKGIYIMLWTFEGMEVQFALLPKRMDGDDLANIVELWIIAIYHNSYSFAKKQGVPMN